MPEAVRAGCATDAARITADWYGRAVGVLFVKMSRQPLVVLSQDELLDDMEFERLFLVLDGLVARAEPFGVLFIVGHGQRPPMERTLRQGQWIKDNRDALQEYCVAFGVVFTSPVIRFLLGTLALAQPFPMPWKTFSDAREGEDWVVALLQRRGLRVPPPPSSFPPAPGD